nr:reverse transcriptase domain-containing protein [Tanacetum cinerariifolium]
ERLARYTAPSAHSSPPPVPSPLLPSSGCPTQIQTLRMASTQAHIDAVTATLPSPSLPPLPPPLTYHHLLTIGMIFPRSRCHLARDAEARQRGIREVGYGIRDTCVDPKEAVLEIAPITIGERVNLLMEDRIARQETILIMEEEAYAKREAWGHSIGLSQAIYTELQTHHDRRQAQMVETLRVMGDIRREMGDMQAELLALREQPRRVRQLGLNARVPDYQDAPRDADKMEVTVRTRITEGMYKLLPDNIYRSVKSSKRKTLDETIELANDFKDQKPHTYAERQTNNKRSLMIYPEITMVINNNPPRGRMSPRNATKCNKIGHFTHNCRSSGNTNVVNAQRDNRNKYGGNVNVHGWVYTDENVKKKGNASRDPESNVFTGNSYDVELVDGKIVGVDTIMSGCTLNFLNHPFNINLMPVELGSFDIIIGMDWLRRCHAVIMCDEKLFRVPYGNETLSFRGDESNDRKESRLIIISFLKAQEYMTKGCQIFLAQISAKKEEDKSKGKQLKDVPIVRDFPKVFPEDFSGLPPCRRVEFQIDLIPGVAPVARAP